MDRPSRALLPWANAVAWVGMLVVNVLSNTLPIAGRTAGEISDLYPTLFTPAGFTFSIWGLIYLGLGAFVVYGLLPGGQAAALRVGGLFALSCGLNALWLLAWHHLLIGLSLLVMLGLLATLIGITLRIDRASLSRLETLVVRVPFSLYLGWITVATVANVAVWLTALGWRGEPLPGAAWAVVAVFIAAGLGLLALRRRGDVVFNLVLVWAFVGIAAARGGEVPVVTGAALGAAAVLIGAMLARTLPHRRPEPLITDRGP